MKTLRLKRAVLAVLFILLPGVAGLTKAMGQGETSIASIGVGSSLVSGYLPIYSYYNYSLSQQIYTAEELGFAGAIYSISFFNTQTERTRNIDLYLVHTNKLTFDNDHDWIYVAEVDRVFTGNVTFLTNEWTTIELDNPFIYDGISNLAIMAYDHTGTWYSPALSFMQFGASNQAVHVHRDSAPYDPLNAQQYNGSVDNVKNQLQIGYVTGDYTFYTIHVTAGSGGVALGGGTKLGGSTCTVKAVPDSHFTLTGWTENGVVVSTDEEYTFTVTGNRDLVANFELASYTINATADPIEGGTVTGMGTFVYGETATLTASAAEDFIFVNWTENGEEVSTDEVYSFMVLSDRDLVANFYKPAFYNITVSPNPVEGGYIEGTGSYQEGTEVTLTANPNPGYGFYNWTVLSVSLNVDFESGLPAGWTIIDANNDGLTWTTVSDIPSTWTYYSGMSLDWYHSGTNAICSGSYINGVGSIYPDEYLVTPQVEPSYGSTFSFWAAAADAGYPADHFGVFVSTTGTNPSDFVSVQEWTLTSKNGGKDGGRASRNSNGAKISTWYNYVVDLSAYAGQSIYIAIRHFNCYDQYIMCVDDITFVTDRSSAVVSTTNPYSFTATCDRELEANFIPVLSSISDDFEDGEINADYWLSFGSDVVEEEGLLKLFQNATDANVGLLSVPMCVTPNNQIIMERRFFLHKGYYNYYGGFAIEFNGDTGVHRRPLNTASWDGVASNTAGVDYLGIVYGHADWDGKYGIYLEAGVGSETHGIRLCDVVLDTWISEAVVVDLSSGKLLYYLDDTHVTTVDVPNLADLSVNYYTVLFSPYGSYYSHYQFMDDVNINTNLDASYTITATAVGGGTVSGGGEFQKGQACTLTATANEDYTFAYWTDNDRVVSTEAEYTFLVVGDHQLVAHFFLPLVITVAAAPEEGGTVTGSGEYDYGTECTLTATANEGYAFLNWTDGGNVVSTRTTYIFPVTDNSDLVANFIQVIPSLSDDFEDGEINTEYWTWNGSNVYEADGLMKIEQNVTDDNVYLHSVPMVPESNNQIVIGRMFMLHRSNTYYYGNNTVLLNGDDNSYVGVQYFYDSYQGRYGTYMVSQINGEYAETYLCDAQFDKWLTEVVTINLSEGTLSYMCEGNEVITVNVPHLTEQEVNFFIMNFRPYGWFTRHYHYMENVNINTNPDAVYTITATANLAEGGTVSGGGEFQLGESCTLTATANEDYTFAYWSNNGRVISTEAEYTFLVVGDYQLVANFAPRPVGLVTAKYDPDPNDNQSPYVRVCWSSESVLQENFESGGFDMNGWEFPDSYPWVISNNNPIEGDFCMKSGNEDVSSSTSSAQVTVIIPYNGEMSFWSKASTEDGYDIARFYIDGQVMGRWSGNGGWEQHVYDITAGEHTFKWSYSKDYIVSAYEDCFYVDNISFLNQSKGDRAVNHYAVYRNGYPMNGTPELIASIVTDTCYVDTGWSDLNEGWYLYGVKAVYSESVDDSLYMSNMMWSSPIQRAYPHTINATANPEEGGSVTGAGVYVLDTECTLTAEPYEGYTFMYWTENGDILTYNPMFSFTVTSDRHFVAHFCPMLQVNVTANPVEGGTVTGEGEFDYNAECTVTAIPNEGYYFLSWVENGVVVSTDASYTFTVTEDRDLVANFVDGFIAHTYYDWQTNQAAITRTVTWPDGKVNFGFTMASDGSYSDRGTGIGTYVFANDEWIPSEGRVEDERTGFGSIARYGANGIVVAAHTADGCPVFIVPDKDNIPVNAVSAVGYLDNTYGPAWPNVMTSGSNRQIIHVIATASSGTIPGMENVSQPVVYFRSTDGGQTWDKQNVVLPYMDADYCLSWGSNKCYWMETTDDNCLALVVNNAWSDGMVIYSYDDGETWQRKVFYKHPDPFGYFDDVLIYPRWTSCQWDSQHRLHVLYEFNATDGSAGSTSFYPAIGGVAYWNEAMPYNSEGTTASSIEGNLVPGQPFVMELSYLNYDIFRSWWHNNYGYADAHEMWPEYVGYLAPLTDDGDPEDPYQATEFNIQETGAHGQYNSGICSFPVLCMVPGTDEMVAVWSALDENHTDANGRYYYKLFASYSNDGGVSWSPMVHLTHDAMFNNAEFIYNQAAVVGRKLIIATQTDAETGSYVMNADYNGSNNFYKGFVFDIDALFDTSSIQKYSITATANPAGGGTVSGAGMLAEGSTCLLTATPNEGFDFVNWTENSEVVSTEATYSFIVTGDRDLVAHFVSNLPDVDQELMLTSGWNWISSYVEYRPESLAEMQELIASECESAMVKSQNDGYVSYAEEAWTGSLSTMDNAQMYLVLVDHDMPLMFFGPQSNPAGHSITLKPGWNWIGYPLTVPMELSEALSGLQPEDGDLIKGNSGYAIYDALEDKWAGNLTTLEPGKGYIYLSASEENRVFVFPFSNEGGGGNTMGGAINGVFTVNDNGDQVYFSKGNLQYQASTNTWRFAENQWDCVGDDNANISQNYSGWIDLFGWGTSGYDHGAVCYQPWSTSTTYSDYYVYGSNNYNLFDQTGQADWGYNAISNGGNQENSGWRTLTQSEWDYLFYTRETVSGIRWSEGSVNGVNGMILLPNDWDASVYDLNDPNGGSFGSNTITTEEWMTVFEANGAVFLPVTGSRYGTSVFNVGSRGRYWSASCDYYMYFEDGSLSYGIGYSRLYGNSVRLVRSAQ